MNSGAVIIVRPSVFRMSVPPYHSTATMMNVPRNSDTGWASMYLRFIFMKVFLTVSFISSNLAETLCSALNALMILSPPRVSSIWLSI